MENRSAIKCKFSELRNKHKKESNQKEEKKIDNYFSINLHINKSPPPTGSTPFESGSVFRSDYILKKKENSVNSVYKSSVHIYFVFVYFIAACCWTWW